MEKQEILSSSLVPWLSCRQTRGIATDRAGLVMIQGAA